MRIQSKAAIGVLAILVVALWLSIALAQRYSATPANAIYRGYLGADHTNLTLWVSNPTPRMIALELGAVETRDGTNWRRSLLWTDKASPSPQLDSLLGVLPYTATQRQMTVATPLEPSSWRLRVVEAQELRGPARYYVGLKWHYKASITPSTNSFGKNATWLGHHKDLIISETGVESE